MDIVFINGDLAGHVKIGKLIHEIWPSWERGQSQPERLNDSQNPDPIDLLDPIDLAPVIAGERLRGIKQLTKYKKIHQI